jgi:ketosteroid isomerase-like protein
MTPEVVTRYLKAADDKDPEALAACFTPDGTVVDEDHTYTGRDEIIGWRESTSSKWTYTTAVTGSESVGDGEYRVFTHLEGDFPGGVADLAYAFTIRGNLIAALHIA